MDIDYIDKHDQEHVLSSSSTAVVTATASVSGAQTHDTLTNSIDHIAQVRLRSIAADPSTEHQQIQP